MPELTGPPTGTVVGVTLYNVTATDTRGTLRTARAIVAESGTAAAPRWEVPWDGTPVDYDWDYTTGGVTTTIPERKYATDPRIATIAGDAASAAISATAIAAKLPATGPVASKADVDGVPAGVWGASTAAPVEGTMGWALGLAYSWSNACYVALTDATNGLVTIKNYLVDKLTTVGVKVATNADKTGYGLSNVMNGPNDVLIKAALTTSLNTYDLRTRLEASPLLSKAPTGWVLVTHATAGQSICADNFGNALGGMAIVAFMRADTARVTPINDAISSSVPGKVGQWSIMLPTGAIDLVFSGAGQRTTTVEVTV